MSIRECYEMLGGEYEEVLSRLRSEERIKKYVTKFLTDPSFEMLADALAQGDMETAFRGAHTLKGVCQNLGFTRLYRSSCQLTELLRPKEQVDTGLCFKQVEEDYALTVAAIGLLMEGNGGI